jgi:hypothetical protein
LVVGSSPYWLSPTGAAAIAARMAALGRVTVSERRSTVSVMGELSGWAMRYFHRATRRDAAARAAG